MSDAVAVTPESELKAMLLLSLVAAFSVPGGVSVDAGSDETGSARSLDVESEFGGPV